MSYHQRMMNVPVPDGGTIANPSYDEGHRDARHACAEIALEADAAIAAAKADIERLKLAMKAAEKAYMESRDHMHAEIAERDRRIRELEDDDAIGKRLTAGHVARIAELEAAYDALEKKREDDVTVATKQMAQLNEEASKENAALREKIDKLERVAGRLPKYIDTGLPVLPGDTTWHSIPGGGACSRTVAALDVPNEGLTSIGAVFFSKSYSRIPADAYGDPKPNYSTESAARTAKKQENKNAT